MRTPGSKPFPYAPMMEKRDGMDRLELRFRWGAYRLRVLHFHLASFPEDRLIRYHKHSEYEFHFIARGSGTLSLEDSDHEFREGMFYLTGPGVLHQQLAGRPDGTEELSLHIDIVPIEDEPSASGEDKWERQEAANCIAALDALGPQPIPDRCQAMPWFLTAYKAVQEAEPGWGTTVKQAVIQILLRAARAPLQPLPQVAHPERDMSLYRYQLITRFIRDNYSSPLSLQDAADRIHVSSRQLQRIMKEQGGVSFSDYLERCRLEQVCEALARNGGSIEQIAAETGFQSGSYLHYVFRKKFGLTPSRYREQMRSQSV
ncbi:AraC family transcriptional regulator [Paenibacillus sp. RUD330]|uniref:helix-turn-helix transcriptional regulator n=1 Tax=Paenibacillus sp. RUD330 TaxID=2023772 RepID=UPI000B926E33|nr:AraC family transcriptional regulator [Paenibacillus sp. RUD330]ASS65014.1 AraC family transcriptional regulator [Paenibacillus sp. RUD330]